MLGLAIGEDAVLVAELAGGDSPKVRRLGEFAYPQGLSLEHDAPAVGRALGEFLQRQGFSGRTAVVGLPAKWLLVKPRELPPADAATAADLLRLQAEGEFSGELMDLVYDYAGEASAGSATTVLLVASPRKQIEAVEALCAAAKLTVAAITASAVALGRATRRERDGLVLSVSASGAELTAQKQGVSTAIRRVRAPDEPRPFIGELRRAISTLPGGEAGRDLMLWDSTGLDAGALGESLAMPVRRADLLALGVDSGPSSNGDGAHYAPAIAVALAGMDAGGPVVDFLHSRLAPLKKRRIPRWAVLGGLAAVLAVVLGVYAYNNLMQQQASLNVLKSRLANMQGEMKSADAFVSKVSFAQRWHSDDPRYLACLRDVTAAFGNDGQTYAVSLVMRETTRVAPGGKTIETGTLSGQCYGKTSDQERFQRLLDQLRRNPAFADVKLGGTQDAGRTREVSFSVTFTYKPPVARIPVAGAPQAPHRATAAPAIHG
jgi:hypothetical protein